MFYRYNAYYEGKRVDSNSNQDHKIRFRNMLLSILAEYKKEGKLSIEVRERLFNKLVYAMVYEFNWLQFIERKESFISTVHLDRYHRIIKYIDENYFKKVTLDDIISMEYMTKTSFSHFWKKISSFSFQERINYERALKSGKMLFSDMTIGEISERCGFSDSKYYYKHFKRWYGCMPLEYRYRCMNYTKAGFKFKELEIKNISLVLEKYLQEYFEIYYDKDEDSEATDTINHYDIDFIPNILIINKEISVGILVESLRGFIKRCIKYYGKVEVGRWRFSIDYSVLTRLEDIDQIYNELSSSIKDLDINYFFEY